MVSVQHDHVYDGILWLRTNKQVAVTYEVNGIYMYIDKFGLTLWYVDAVGRF